MQARALETMFAWRDDGERDGQSHTRIPQERIRTLAARAAQPENGPHDTPDAPWQRQPLQLEDEEGGTLHKDTSAGETLPPWPEWR